MRVHLRVHFHCLTGNVTQESAEPLRGDDKERQNEDADESQAPFEREHDREQGNRFDEVGHDVDDGIADGVLRADHIVVEAGHQLTDFGVGKESQGHALQSREEGRAQVVDHALTHCRVQPPLNDIDPASDRRDNQQCHPEQNKTLRILGRNHHVDHVAENERREQG